MATILAPAAAQRADPERLFFTGAGLCVLIVVFAGFARTYYLSDQFAQPSRMPPMTPVLAWHAAAFTAWILLMAVQPALIAAGRIKWHIRFGMAGLALAALVWALGNVAAVQAMRIGYREVGDPYAFYAVTFFSMQAFALIATLGFLQRRNPAAHKRLMLLSNAAILEAAVGRLPLELVARTAPLSFYLGADLVIAAGMVFDRRTRGQIHSVWLWGGGLLLASQILRVAIMDTGPWLAFARWMAGLA